MLTADAEKFTKIAQWQPRFNLEDMVRHAWAWYTK
jgi:UDP-glucose 4-epimerase